MSIDDGFKKMLAGVKQADEGRDEIMAGLEEAWEGRTNLDKRLDDLQEGVQTLQALVMEQQRTLIDQGQTIAALRDKLNS